MSVCPFCKAQVAQSTAACPRCGKLAADHPSIAAISGRTLSTDFDDDDPGGLDIESTGLGSGGVGGGGGGHGMSFESSKGVTLDDDLFGDDEHSGPLELDDPRPPSIPDIAPPPPAPPISSKMPAAPAAPPSSTKTPAAPPAAPSSGRLPATPSSVESGPHPAAAAAGPPEPPPPPSPQEQAAVRIANYPPPPQKIWEAPRYALRVLYRQFELKQDLESLRRKRSPDVALYERALRTHDPRMYKTGLAITGVAVFLGLVLFFMPVIKRFAFAPD